MQVRFELFFASPGAEELDRIRSAATALTNRAASVRVGACEVPGWLFAEFAMKTEPQVVAVDTIDDALSLFVENWSDSKIYFPKSEAEQARANRKAERRKARRAAERA